MPAQVEQGIIENVEGVRRKVVGSSGKLAIQLSSYLARTGGGYTRRSRIVPRYSSHQLDGGVCP